MKKISIFIAWMAILGIGLYLQADHAKYHLIIDTDCCFDDLRAILMFLADNEFEVLAITTSEGSLTPSDGLRKIPLPCHCCPLPLSYFKIRMKQSRKFFNFL
jgi:pyrimidine-specific ribonucleoside hydrolase